MHIPSNEELIHAVGMRVSRSFRSLSSANLVGLAGGGGGGRLGASRSGLALSRLGRQHGQEQEQTDLGRDARESGSPLSSEDGEHPHQTQQQQHAEDGGVEAAAVQSPPALSSSSQQQQQQQQQQHLAASTRSGGRPPLSPSPGKLPQQQHAQRRRSLSLDEASSLALAP